MYGANAFAGVINIITKGAKALVPNGKHIGWDARPRVSDAKPYPARLALLVGP